MFSSVFVEHCGPFRLGSDHDAAREPLLDPVAGACESAPGACAGDEHIYITQGIQNFNSRSVVVNPRIDMIFKLKGHI